jgi:prevent-host-death family protein
MKVKTGELKNNLSRYLKRLVETGESITILDRDRPVARIMPLRGKRGAKPSAWSKERARVLERAAKLGIKLSMPETEPKLLRDIPIIPRKAPDGKQGIETVASMRGEKNY